MIFFVRIITGFLLSAVVLILTIETRQISEIFAKEQIAFCAHVRSPNKQRTAATAAASESLNDLNYDALVDSNRELIRPRPRNLRLVFVGDSLTRYQYLSLAYFLRHGRWWDPSITVNNLVNAHSFRHPFHPNEDWNEFFFQSNRLLHPLEICDCERTSVPGQHGHVSVERRYFHDKERNNTVVYINLSGNVTDDIRPNHYYGRINSEGLWSHFDELVGVLPPLASMPRVIVDRNSIANNTDRVAWEYKSWGDVVAQHLGGLSLGQDTPVVLNAGLHPHQFHNAEAAIDLKLALDAAGFRGVWKTTTYTKDEIRAKNTLPFRVRRSDSILCKTMDCFNISWTAGLNPSLYDDQYHFHEPVYRILNEELLDSLGLLPSGYIFTDRDTVLQ